MLESPVYCAGDPKAVLQYDDGIGWWVAWAGTYRAVWFFVNEFSPVPVEGFDCEQLEYWFYHHASFPWTSASFESILANTGQYGPGTQLASESVTAAHYTPAYAVFGSIITEYSFYAIDHSLVAGGWPSLVADSTSQNHWRSFYSDYYSSGYTHHNGDYFIRAHGTILTTGLDYTSWGAIKSLFGQQ
ncbi:hypothetical protein JW921_06645 [Candidatus Fermentibacterales bacterium]|nr:hypothetical protein [Candidatus Fermentibacterales bacterium]